MLLSGPPSVLIFVEPRIQVNAVVDRAATELETRNTEFFKERDADPEVSGSLVLTENARFGQTESVTGPCCSGHTLAANCRIRRRRR